MTREETENAARRLFDAERHRKQIGLLSLEFPNAGLDEAYAVQSAFMQLKLESGRTAKGWKIGLTSKAMQSTLRINVPDSGVLLDDMFFCDTATIPADRFIEPRIEAEIAFVMKTGLKGPDVSVFDVLSATEYVTPALEILDTRILRMDPATKKMRTIFDTVSDNAANAGIVTGGRAVRPLDMDMRWVGAIISRNAEIEETGLGAGVLNHPAAGIAWLANRLGTYGSSIAAGDVVLSGSFVRPVEARHGDTIVADFGRYGTVSVFFA